MSNEVTLSATIQHTKNPKVGFNPGAIRIDQAGEGVHSATVDVGTSDEAIDFGDIVTEGVCVLWNLDDTNYVEFGPESGGSIVPVGRLLPGGIPAISRLAGGHASHAGQHRSLQRPRHRLRGLTR